MKHEMIPELAQRKIAPAIVQLTFDIPLTLARNVRVHSIEAAQLRWGNELGMRYGKEQLVFRSPDTFSLGFEGPVVKMGRDATSGALFFQLIGGARNPANSLSTRDALMVQLEFYRYNSPLLSNRSDIDSMMRLLADKPVLYRLWASRKQQIVAACPCSEDPDTQLIVAKEWLEEISSEPYGEELIYTVEFFGA